MDGVKNQIMCLFKTKNVETVYGGEKKQSEKNITKSIRNVFKLKQENEAIKDTLVRAIRMFLNKKMIITNQQEYVIFGTRIISNMKVVVILIETYR